MGATVTSAGPRTKRLVEPGPPYPSRVTVMGVRLVNPKVRGVTGRPPAISVDVDVMSVVGGRTTNGYDFASLTALELGSSMILSGGTIPNMASRDTSEMDVDAISAVRRRRSGLKRTSTNFVRVNACMQRLIVKRPRNEAESIIKSIKISSTPAAGPSTPNERRN